jgi:hypothetical protein
VRLLSAKAWHNAATAAIAATPRCCYCCIASYTQACARLLTNLFLRSAASASAAFSSGPLLPPQLPGCVPSVALAVLNSTRCCAAI